MASYIKVDPSDPRYNPFGGGMVQVPDGTPGSTTIADPTGPQASPDLVQQVVAAQNKPGGIPAGYYTVNPDGTLTLTKQYGYGQPGDKVAANGAYLQPDGTPRLGPDGKPGFSVITPTGAPATDNPNFKGDDGGKINGIIDAGKNIVTSNNPIVGTGKAVYDVATGKWKQAGSDFAAGNSFGTLPKYDPKTGKWTAGDTTRAAADAAGVPPGVPGVTGDVDLSGLENFLSGLGSGGVSGDRTVDPGAQSEVDRANNLADVLGGERQKYGAAADADKGLGLQTREQQEQSIQQLQDAASGKTPSAAELALTRQSGIDAARQYGLAAALQGNNPSAALRQASMGAAKVAGDTAANAAQLRATEQANARTSLANALAGVRQSDQGVVNSDVTQQNNAQTGETTSQGQGVTAEGNILQRQSAKDQADATKEGAEIAGVASGLSTIFGKPSDKRLKKDVKEASLADELGKGVHGVVFKYESPETDDGGKHFGLLAQQLEGVIPGVVKKNPEGMRIVDTGHLSLGNTAVLAELARRIMELEKKGGKR